MSFLYWFLIFQCFVSAEIASAEDFKNYRPDLYLQKKYSGIKRPDKMKVAEAGPVSVYINRVQNPNSAPNRKYSHDLVEATVGKGDTQLFASLVAEPARSAFEIPTHDKKPVDTPTFLNAGIKYKDALKKNATEYKFFGRLFPPSLWWQAEF